MCRKNVLTIVAVVMFALAIGQAQAVEVPVPNGEFNLYKPGTNYTVRAYFPTGNYYIIGLGDNVPVEGGLIVDYADATTGTAVDAPGWVTPLTLPLWRDTDTNYEDEIETFVDFTTGICQLFTWGYDPMELQDSSALNCFGSWSSQNGTLAESADSLGNIEVNTAYTLSAMVEADAAPLTFELRANGVIITPSASVTPGPVTTGWEVISRTYDVVALAAYVGQPMTIVVGTTPPHTMNPLDPDILTGGRGKFDNISLSSEFAFQPTGLIPADGENVAASFNLLQWTLPTPAVPETGTVTCDVWFSEASQLSAWSGYDPNFSNYATKIVDNGTDESKPVTLAEFKTYYWRIDLYDDSNPDPQPFIGMVYTFNTQNAAPQVDAGEADATWLTDGTVDFDLLGSWLVADDGRPVAAALMWTVTGEPSAGAATFVTDPNNNLGVTVRATQAGTYELTLTADDTVYTGSDTVSILVYNDWCDALRTTGSLVPHETDYNGDCITDMRDFAILAGEWMMLITDVVPVVGLVPNGDFETIYKPGQTVITGALSEGAWTQGVGSGCPIDETSGTFEFSDETSGTVADIPGWVGYDLAGWKYFTNLEAPDPVSYDRDPNDEDRQGSVSNQANHTDGEEAVNCYMANGGGWGNAVGGMIISKNPVATVTADTAYEISMFAKGADGTEAPLVLDLLANGVKITPDASANPALLTDLWRKFSRTYDADTMSAYEGQSLKIVVGLGRPLPAGAVGAQLQLDDVAIVGYSN